MGKFGFVDDDSFDEEEKETDKEQKVRAINVPYRNAVVVLMNHPASLCLYKYVHVNVISGVISINGYIMKNADNCEVFSSEKTGLLEIKTETPETIWRKKSPKSTLFQTISEIFNCSITAEKIFGMMEYSTVMLYIKRIPYPSAIEFVTFYNPQVFTFNLFKNSPNSDILWFENNKKSSAPRFSAEVEELACKLAKLINHAQLIDNCYPKILIYGPRNSGKSTLLKYLINKILPELEFVHYLDTDPGQPEFTPPGVVSLTEVCDPILGPPFFHQNKATRMKCVGDVSPSFFDVYKDSVKSLMNIYDEEKLQTLFVNTMGWLEGTGLQCLINTITDVQPTVLIEIVVNNETTMFDYRPYLHHDVQYFAISCKHDPKSRSTLSAKEIRELSLLSYFGQNQPSYLQPSPINELRPYCVSWEKIAIFIYPERNVPPHRMIQALNGSIVALCYVDEHFIVPNSRENYPSTLNSDTPNECLGFGLVKAVDEVNHLLNIITPLKEEELRNVNAIIKGNVMVPDVLILQQNVYGVELPNTNIIEKRSVEDDPMDVSMVSLKYFSETESETNTPESRRASSKKFSLTESYRKPAAKRYGHHNFSKNK